MQVQSGFSVDEWLERVQQAVRDVALTPRELPLDRVIAKLSQLQAEGAGHHVDSHLLQQVDRNFAQLIFTESMGRRLPLDVCRQFFSAVCQAGFFHPQHKSQFHELFARYCYESGQAAEAQRILGALRDEVVANMPPKEDGSWQHDELTRIDAILSGIASNQLPPTWLPLNEEISVSPSTQRTPVSALATSYAPAQTKLSFGGMDEPQKDETRRPKWKSFFQMVVGVLMIAMFVEVAGAVVSRLNEHPVFMGDMFISGVVVAIFFFAMTWFNAPNRS